ncbi:MAG: hypothetical protein Tsb0010_15700 [Parvularculaceae bacterium]
MIFRGKTALALLAAASVAMAAPGQAQHSMELRRELARILDAAMRAGTEGPVAWTLVQSYPELAGEIFDYARIDPRAEYPLAVRESELSPYLADPGASAGAGIAGTSNTQDAAPPPAAGAPGVPVPSETPARTDAQPRVAWSGEGEIGAGLTTGNSDTANVAVAGKAVRESGAVRQTAVLDFGFTRTDGATTQQRIFSSYQLDYDYSSNWFSFTRAEYENDRFSGFDYRIFLGVGLGAKLIAGDRMNWTVTGGPGARYSVEDVTGVDVITPSARASSVFDIALTETATFIHEAHALWTSETTTAATTFSLDTKLNSFLDARLSYNIRYETDPPAGAVNTDTTARAAIVFKY